MESRITNLASRLQDFTKLMSSTQDRPEDVKIQLESIEKTVEEEVREIDIRCEVLARSVNTMMNEWRLSRKKKPGVFNTAETADESWREDFAHSAEGMNFLNIAYNGAVAIRGLMHKFQEIMVETRPSTVFMPTNTPRRDSLDIEDMQRLHFLSQMNAPAVQAYADAMLGLDTMHKELAEAAETISNYLELYYRALVKRHTVDGVAIHRDAVLTDVAMHIYENIDAEGEIAMGRSPDELSAYSKRKARVMTEAIQDPFVHEIMTAEHGLISFLVDNLEMVSTSVTRTATLLRDESKKLRALIGGRVSLETNSHRSKYSRLMVNIRDLDPSAVSHKAKAGLQTHDEKFRDRFRDETMGHIVQMLVRQAPTEEIIPYVLERKEKIRRYFQEENSFYTCSIGAGNPFLGVAPGGIQISPSARPLASFDDIVGAGFPELKGFVRTIRGATLWHDLFAATSPSKSADKSNILMMGPQGCGKTEAMRSIASEKDSIAIFAVGSDFKTCWKDEGLKNPKRLFEHAVRLQKDSQKHVHILIDEADSVMCKKEFLSQGDDDLTTEFQNLMDGIVQYPNITVWAATNHPERMPMPIIRRFSKVLVVGELTSEDRVFLLKRFFSYLPLEAFGEDDWRSISSQLDGATGDVIRKVVDTVWRSKMAWFTETMPEAAESVKGWLNRNGKFSVADMPPEDRTELIVRLGEHFRVTVREVRAAVEAHMKNVATRTEITAANEVYENARKVVSSLSGNLIVPGGRLA
jgi:uncharacterized protein YbjQ (UPF0145 family)